MIRLKDYQIEACEAIESHFLVEDSQYVAMPTGSGKTFTFLSYADDCHDNILVIVPSKSLLHQVYESALLFFDRKDISRKGDGYDEKIGFLHICTAQSMRGDYLKELCEHPFDLVVIDEAHHSHAMTYKRFIDCKRNRCKDMRLSFLGVTATPDRADGKLLSEIFGTCSFRLEIEDMIEKGHLCDIEGYSVKTKIDISDVDDHNGDFSLRQLYKKLCIDSRNEMIVKLCKEEMKDRKTVVFCINIEHSLQIHNLLTESGLSSEHIDGTTSSKKKESILKSFREGSTQFICNCQLLTEGFDEPSIDGIIIARPTRSRSLFTQMVGRGLRIFPGKKNCKIIDVVDNHRALAGFNSLLEDCAYPEMDTFKSIHDIRKHIGEERLKVTEFRIERSDIFSSKRLDEIFAIPWQLDRMREKAISFFEPITFDEANFLIWLDNLKEKYNG